MPQQINWAFCQSNSDKILAEGIFALRAQPMNKHHQITLAECGNYLISLKNDPYYIGEAKEIVTRLKQQFKPRTSTFHKNYVNAGIFGFSPIDAFEVQSIATNIGRKEIEEFGIVNVPTKLNKFQIGKRSQMAHANGCELWLEVQAQSGEFLLQGEKELLAQSCAPWFEASVPHEPGIYIVRADSYDEIIYIGESSDIGARYETHSGQTYFSALRRHIATEILGFTLKTIKGKTRYLSENEDNKVTDFLRTCRIAFLPISLGRFEQEEFLIRKNRPVLNRKDNDAIG